MPKCRFGRWCFSCPRDPQQRDKAGYVMDSKRINYHPYRSYDSLDNLSLGEIASMNKENILRKIINEKLKYPGQRYNVLSP